MIINFVYECYCECKKSKCFTNLSSIFIFGSVYYHLIEESNVKYIINVYYACYFRDVTLTLFL